MSPVRRGNIATMAAEALPPADFMARLDRMPPVSPTVDAPIAAPLPAPDRAGRNTARVGDAALSAMRTHEDT